MTAVPQKVEQVARALAEYAGIPWEDLISEARAAIMRAILNGHGCLAIMCHAEIEGPARRS